MLLHDLLLHSERTSASRTAIIDGAVRRDYGELAGRVRSAAAGLAQRGLRRGQRVAIIAANTSDFLEAYFALSLSGLTAVPVNIRLSAPEVAFILEDSDCAAVLVDEALGALGSSAPSRITLGPDDASGWNDLIRSGDAASTPSASRDENAVTQIFYTGGTTGRPKGVMLSHRNVIASAMNKLALGSFTRDDVWLHAAPMFHQADAWAVFTFTALGATHVFIPSFTADAALDVMQRHRVTSVQLVPTMIAMLLDQTNIAARDLSRMRRILYGSAPMPTSMLERAASVFGNVFQHIYGLTEAAGTVAATPWPPSVEEQGGKRMTSCGQPIIGVEMRIADDAGFSVPAHQVGHIQVRGANVMRGYWQRDAETAAAFVDGWLDTGDLGYMDRGGFVYIVDRAKDMIISGGENIYSTEVENVIYRHPDIDDAAVIGLPDPKWGEAVTAVVTVRAGATMTQDALLAHCRQHLARYKCPKRVHILGAMPRSAAGKILKQVLRERLTVDALIAASQARG